MKTKYLAWAVSAALVAFFLLAKYEYDGIDAVDARAIEETMEQEARLVQGKCTMNEKVDRWLLQQSWFYDDQFTDLAGAFGQSSFGMFERGGAKQNLIEGAFCIAGTDLVVRYFNTRYVPSGFEFRSLFDWTIKFGSELIPIEEDVYTVQELTKKRMILKFASDGGEHVFYRKN